MYKKSFTALRRRVTFQLYKQGYKFLPLLRPLPNGPLVLIYHNVEADECTLINKLGVSLSPAHFADHVRYLAANYDLLSFSRICRERDRPRAVAVTFDDGYRSILTTVLPVIERYHCPIKIYLTTTHILEGISWLNHLSYLMNVLSERGLRELAQAALCLPMQNRQGPVTIWDFIAHFDVDRTPAVIGEAFARLRPCPTRRLYLDETEIRQLAAHPLVELGSHTRNHYPLPRLDGKRLRAEIVENHDYLRSLFGEAINGFCIPFGYASHMTREVVDMIRRVDSFAVSAYGGQLDDNRLHGLAEVKRIGVWGNLGTLWYRLRYATQVGVS
jgi:peptidoglycan/xylan/chitin deacetylase (PgdA/CDA1 family)